MLQRVASSTLYGQQMRSVPRLLVGYTLAISHRSGLGEVHRGLFLSCTPSLEVVMDQVVWGYLLDGLQEVVWASN
jgi:hypothetical protein